MPLLKRDKFNAMSVKQTLNLCKAIKDDKNKIVLIGPYLVTIQIHYLVVAGRQAFSAASSAESAWPWWRAGTFHKDHLVYAIFESNLSKE